MELQSVYEKIVNNDADFFKKISLNSIEKIQMRAARTWSYFISSDTAIVNSMLLLIGGVVFYLLMQITVDISREIGPIWYFPAFAVLMILSFVVAQGLSVIVVLAVLRLLETIEGHPNAILHALKSLDPCEIENKVLKAIDYDEQAKAYLYHCVKNGRKSILNIDVQIIKRMMSSS